MDVSNNRGWSESGRVPLPWPEALRRLKLAGPAEDPRNTLDRTRVVPQVLHEFVPLCESLEWRLSGSYWSSNGLLPFLDNEVPFVINNTGRLSEHAAAVFFGYCEEAGGDRDLTLLELGAGSGLFARYFLDAFRAICEQERRGFYNRLRYLVSDGSERTVHQWRERGMFEGHDRVVLGVCDAQEPRGFRSGTGDGLGDGRVDGVICNYLLDVLPSRVVRLAGESVEELCVRTHLPRDPALLKQHTRLTWDELRAAVESPDSSELLKLVPLMGLFEFETAFRAMRLDGVPYLDELRKYATSEGKIVLNHGALRCLEGCLERVGDRGFVLINDYGPTDGSQVAGHAASQRFGPTSALGLEFPFLEYFLGSRGCQVIRPSEDEKRPIHARLVVRGQLPRMATAFRNRFGGEAYRFWEEPLEEARQHRAAGRKQEALDAYRTGLGRNARDWHVLGEIAEFVGLDLQDYSAGVEMARAALERNPWFSPWLWNVLGDCLFCLERYEEAHEAYLQAQRIHPGDVRTNLNLAYTCQQRGELERALAAIASGLAGDRTSQYRERLLRKQGEVLAVISVRAWAEVEQLSRRAARLLEASPAAMAAPRSTAGESSG